MTNGFAHYYTPFSYLDVVIRSLWLAIGPLSSALTDLISSVVTTPSVCFGTFTSTAGIFGMNGPDMFWRRWDGGRLETEQNRTEIFFLGMSKVYTENERFQPVTHQSS